MDSNRISGSSSGASAALARKVDELVIYGPDGGLHVMPFGDKSVSVGRATSNTLAYPDDNGLSRQHFVIERVGGEVVLRDLGSKNGTELNSQPIPGPTKLNPGDRIKAGRLTIEYRTGDMR